MTGVWLVKVIWSFSLAMSCIKGMAHRDVEYEQSPDGIAQWLGSTHKSGGNGSIFGQPIDDSLS